jgi:biotin operon repressor
VNPGLEKVARNRTLFEGGRVRNQQETIRDVMLAASDAGDWLTLGDLRELTGFPEASISAQLRNLRADGFTLDKRHPGKQPEPGSCYPFPWEYFLLRPKK